MHRWTFFRAGGVDQVLLETTEDFASLDQLDQKLWAALSCPTRGLEIDSRTLDLIDTDLDGRIRVPEVLAAVRWLCQVVKDPSAIVRGEDSVALDSLRSDTPEGRLLLASARRILSNLGRPDATHITLADATNTAAIFSQTPFNGDGVLPVSALEDPAAAAVAKDIIDCLGGEGDRSGAPGITQARIEQFFREMEQYDAWQRKAEENAAVLCLGEATPAASEAVSCVRAKVEDFFSRCTLAAFDSRATAALNRAEAEYHALASKDLSACSVEIAALPLARVEPDRPLPLQEGINPAWAGPMARLRGNVVERVPALAGRAHLTRADWQEMINCLAPYEAWRKEKPATSVERLGLARIREILAGNSREALAAAILQDRACEAEMREIVSVERLVRYHRDLHTLLCNFVSFRDFYSRRQPAIFQAGTLYLDSRACELCLRVEDVAKHSTLATLSKTYLLYCDCTRRGAAEKMTLVAAVTAGDTEHLMAGRNGVFYDRQGRDWDATITKIIEHPTSLRQAALLPYRRIGRMVGEQIERIAAAREKAAQDKAAAGIAQAAATAQAPAQRNAAPAQGMAIGQTVGILAAIGLALGALGTAVAALFSSFMKLLWWQMPLVVLGLFVAVSGPSIILTWLKLRQRNLGPMLDASGWAVNGRVRINIPFGTALTHMAALPPGAARIFTDPCDSKAARRRRRLWAIFLALALAFALWELLALQGYIHWPL